MDPEQLDKNPLTKVKPNELKCEVESLMETLPFNRGSAPCKLAVKNADSYLVAYRDIGLLLYEKGKLYYSSVDPMRRFADLEHLDVVYVKSLNYYLLCSNNKLSKKRIDSSAPYLFMDIELNAMEVSCFKMVPDHRYRVMFVDKGDQLFLVNLKTGKIEMRYSRKLGDQEGEQDTRLRHYQPHRVNWKVGADPVNPEIKRSVVVTQVSNDDKIISVCLQSHQTLNTTNLKPHLPRFDGDEDESAIDLQSFTLCPQNRYLLLKTLLCNVNGEDPILILFELAEDYGLNFVTSLKNQKGQGPQSWGALSCLVPVGYFGQQRLLFVGAEDSWVKKDVSLLFFEFDVQTKTLIVVSNLKTGFGEKHVTGMWKVGDYFYFIGELGKVMRFRLVKA